jgi:AraC family transcriptional regulator of adaptative response/methylated-DNA-[protein]-cysteine methyltransferase
MRRFGIEGRTNRMKTKRIPNRADLVLRDPRWASLVSRDRNADGRFFFSVESTGVYCRPSCGARRPRPENVQFYATTEEAEAAGYRACKRCKPNELSPASEVAARIAKACRLIEKAENTPSLQAMAKLAGMSRFHFHRTFKSITGITPAEYASAQRTARVRESLERSKTVTDAIYDAGFNSSSRFYEGADRALGMTPTEFRSGGANAEIYFAIGECSMGNILAAQTERGVCAILMGDDAELLVRNLQDRFPNAKLVGDAPQYQDLLAKVVGLVENPKSGFGLPLDIQGTAFQKRVWKALQQIPPGTTATYTEIAAKIGMPKAVRAVAQACGANSLAVAIPCHRVIRNDGSLSGYRWGVERKRTLLHKEKQA